MEYNENTVATEVPEEQVVEAPADDAQAAEVISAADLAAELMKGKGAGETAENTGDGDQPAKKSDPAKHDQQQAKNERSNQMRAALRQQRKTIFEDELGESEETVRELIRAHRAAKLAQENPDVSPKAARMIVEAREQAQQPKEDKATEDMTAAVQSLIDDGWTAEELRAFVADETAQADMANGKSVRQAARAFEKRQYSAPPSTKKSSVPTFRNAATSSVKRGNLIAEMSDEEFARFSERAYEALMDGKKVTFD